MQDELRVTFVSQPMSDQSVGVSIQDQERYRLLQLQILVAAAVVERIDVAYQRGWHMRVGRN